MTKIKVLDTGYDSFAYEKQLFEINGYEFAIWPGDKGDIEGKMDFASDADGLLIRWTEINDEFLGKMSNLVAIVRYGVGYENIDIDSVTRAGVKVANVQGYGNHAVSDHALALMYACNRMLPEGQLDIKDSFGAPPAKRILDFHECTLGIVGLGRIGGTLAQKAVHLFRRVIASDPYIKDQRFSQLGVHGVNLEEVLAQSDVISVHCNHTEETTNLLNMEMLSLTEKCPIIINTARGPIVNQESLVEAIDNNQVFRAGIDVFNTELAAELPDLLLNHPKIICTGHYAWYSQQSHEELQKRAADNLIALLEGQQVDDCLNP
jgi:D-3-phosphoglycerate dehydrogenase